jgi:hypothetical protein
MKRPLNSILLSVLLLLCPSLAAFDIKLYPASEVYDADVEFFHERLGVDEQQMSVEEFENDQLASWLSTNLKVGVENTASAWVGPRTSTPAESAQFDIQLPNARVFGIGISQDGGGDERISINGNTPIELKRFPGFERNGIGRAYYLLAIATPNDPDIGSIVIDHGKSVLFDHLMVLGSKEPPTRKTLGPRLVLRLNDGRHLVGFAQIGTISVSAEAGKSDLALERIDSVRCQAPGNRAIIFLRTGEKLSCELQTSKLKLSTREGEVSVAPEAIKELKVTPRGEFTPVDARSERLTRTDG